MKIHVSQGQKEMWRGSAFTVYLNGIPRAAFNNINDANEYRDMLESKYSHITIITTEKNGE